MILTHLAHFWSFCTWLVSVKVEFDTEGFPPGQEKGKKMELFRNPGPFYGLVLQQARPRR